MSYSKIPRIRKPQCNRNSVLVEIEDRDQLELEIFRLVFRYGFQLDELGSSNGFVSPKYWQDILDRLDSTYVIEGTRLNRLLNWRNIASFVFDIFSCPDINLATIFNMQKRECMVAIAAQINRIMKRHNFQKYAEFVDFVISLEHSDTSSDNELAEVADNNNNNNNNNANNERNSAKSVPVVNYGNATNYADHLRQPYAGNVGYISDVGARQMFLAQNLIAFLQNLSRSANVVAETLAEVFEY